MNPATKILSGRLYSSAGSSDLLEPAASHHCDAVTKRHRLGLVVGDVDGGGAESLLQPRHHGAHLHAQLRIEIRKRLVHQERLWVADDRSPHRHSLALAAGEVRGPALEVLGEVEDLRRVLHLVGDLGLGTLASFSGNAMFSRTVIWG